nr:hypothetical protein [uncultured Haemophilus sp.]
MKKFLYVLTAGFFFSGNLYAEATKPIESKIFTEQMNTRYSTSEVAEILKSAGATDVEVVDENNVLSFNSKGLITKGTLSIYDDNGDINFLQILPNDPKQEFFLTLEEANELNGKLIGKIEIISDRLFLSVTLRNNGNGLSRKQIIQGFDDFKALSGKVIDAMVLKTLKEKEEAKK